MNILYKILFKVKDEKVFKRLMEITFTENELNFIEERWKVFDSLSNGMSQRKAAKKTKCSIVTITRGAKVYKKNKQIIDKFLSLYKKQ